MILTSHANPTVIFVTVQKLDDWVNPQRMFVLMTRHIDLENEICFLNGPVMLQDFTMRVGNMWRGSYPSSSCRVLSYQIIPIK